MNNSEYIYIGVMLLLVIYFIRKDGIIKGIYFSLFLFSMGAIVGLAQSGYFFGRIGEYIFLFFIIIYGAFIYFKCPKELKKSLEGQGICIKREWKRLISFFKGM